MTVGDFLDVLCNHAKCEIPKKQDPKLLRPVDVTMQIPDVTKFKAKTGWKSSRTLSDSIDFLLEHFRKTVT